MKYRASLSVALLSTGCAALSGCSHTHTTTASSAISSVSVSCSPSAIQTTQTSQCSATVSGTGSYSSTVNWLASGGTVNSGGVFTPSAAGKVTVTAVSTQDSGKSGSASVTVSLASAAYQVFGIDYSPYVGSQTPNTGAPPSDDQITQQLELLATFTKEIRTYSCTGQEHVPQIAKQLGLKVYMGVWIGTDAAANQNEINSCVAIAKSVGVDAIIVGSEALLNGYASPQQLIAYIGQVRAAVPGVPISTADTNTVLENNPDVVAVCDFVFVNYYPFWEGTDISTAMGTLNAEDALLRSTYAPKDVIVSETGWKSFGATVGSAVPSVENAASYFLDFESWAQAGKRETFYFEAHDEPWKGTEDGWGIWDQNLSMKAGMMAVFNGQTVADNWTCNAVPGGSGPPLLQFTSVPALGSSAWLQGQEWHEPPGDYHLVAYIHVGSLGWWVKPYAANPITLLNCDGTWSVNIVTGGEDASADTITAFLIPATYNPPILEGAGGLPQELYTNSVANVTANR